MKKGMNKSRVKGTTGVVLCCVVLSAMTMSCKQEAVSSNEFEESILLTSQEVKLGNKIANPFAMSNARSAGVTAEPNYYYFRCRSDDTEKLIWLRDAYVYLETIPMDYEISEGGTFYDDPDIDEESECPWLYFMKPAADKELIESQGFIVEVLEEMYVPEEVIDQIDDSTKLETTAESTAARAPRKPSGTVKVVDTTLGAVPVPRVTVWMSQAIFTSYAETNDKGEYSSWFGYSEWLGSSVRHKVVFSNALADLHGDGSLLQFILPAFYQVAVPTKRISNYQILLAANTQHGYLGSTMKAVKDYSEFADANGIVKADKLRIWVIPFVGGGMAPMMRQLFSNDFNPDIIIGCNGIKESIDLSVTVYHELSHASHYTTLRNNSAPWVAASYWKSLYTDMVIGWADTLFSGGNVISDPYNDGESELVKLIESWANYNDYSIAAKIYPTYATSLISELEQKSKGHYYNNTIKDVFYYSAFYDLSKTYTVSQIFSGLNQIFVNSAQSYINNFVSMYASNNDAERARISQIFLSNGAVVGE